MSAILLHMAWP